MDSKRMQIGCHDIARAQLYMATFSDYELGRQVDMLRKRLYNLDDKSGNNKILISVVQRIEWLSLRLSIYESAFGTTDLGYYELCNMLETIKGTSQVRELLAADKAYKEGLAPEEPLVTVTKQEVLNGELQHVQRFISVDWMTWAMQHRPMLSTKQRYEAATDRMIKEVFPEGTPQNLIARVINEQTFEVVMSVTTTTRV